MKLFSIISAMLVGAPALAGEGSFSIETLDIPQVTLVDQEARVHAFPGQLTRDRTLVINFNYTTCDSICPIGNDIMAQLDEMLGDDQAVTLLSITIDPGRDTPAHMRKAAETFGSSDKWLWLTGDPGEVERLLRAFDADQVVVELHDPIFMVGDLTSGRFYRSQSMPDAEELAALVETLVE